MLYTRDHPVYTPALLRPIARKVPVRRKIGIEKSFHVRGLVSVVPGR
jgi:hypothetical protein